MLVPQTANVLAALPRSAHPGAKKALAEIWGAEDKDHAQAAVKAFEAAYGAKFPKAVAKITDDVEELLAFYDYPAEHWVHLRTTDENVNRMGWLGCARGLAAPARSCLILRPAAAVKVERPAGRTTLTAVRTAVASGCGRAQLTAKRRAGRGTGSPAALLSLRA